MRFRGRSGVTGSLPAAHSSESASTDSLRARGPSGSGSMLRRASSDSNDSAPTRPSAAWKGSVRRLLDGAEEPRQPAARVLTEECLFHLGAEVGLVAPTGVLGREPARTQERKELELAARVVGPLVRGAVRVGAEGAVEPRHVRHLAGLAERVVLVAALVGRHLDLAAEQARLRGRDLLGSAPGDRLAQRSEPGGGVRALRHDLGEGVDLLEQVGRRRRETEGEQPPHGDGGELGARRRDTDAHGRGARVSSTQLA